MGRPSTYASILSTIQEREYVKKEGGRFTPTELGMVVVDLLLECFDDIFDVTFTARMEEALDEIEDGRIHWRDAMADFYGKFEKDLERAETEMTNIKRMEKPTDLICDKCGKECEVPFKPTSSKPVYCSDCFKTVDSPRRESGNKPSPSIADFDQINNDLYWKFYAGEDEFVRWTGYDDNNWWDKVSKSDNFRQKTGKHTGRIFELNPDTNEVEIRRGK